MQTPARLRGAVAIPAVAAASLFLRPHSRAKSEWSSWRDDARDSAPTSPTQDDRDVISRSEIAAADDC